VAADRSLSAQIAHRAAELMALTICQPYAHLIARGEKRIENRTWPTAYRGPLVIHAGKSREWLNGEDTSSMAFGAVVAVVDLIGCQRIEDLKGAWAEHAYANGPWCWMFGREMVVLKNPVEARGAQGLWKLTERTAAEVIELLRRIE
jgi:hypothetical protein